MVGLGVLQSSHSQVGAVVPSRPCPTFPFPVLVPPIHHELCSAFVNLCIVVNVKSCEAWGRGSEKWFSSIENLV